MFTKTMNSDEIFQEFLKDSDELTRQCKKYTLSHSFKQLRREGQRFPIIKTIEIKLKSGNLYFLTFTIPDRRSLFRNDFPVQCSILLNENNGYKVIFVTDPRDRRPRIVTVTPHVLSRYRERLHLEIEGKELIKHFVENCAIFVSRVENYETGELMVSNAIGVFLGNCWRGNLTTHHNLKTFIADETIKSGTKRECIDGYNDSLDLVIKENPQGKTRSTIKAVDIMYHR